MASSWKRLLFLEGYSRRARALMSNIVRDEHCVKFESRHHFSVQIGCLQARILDPTQRLSNLLGDDDKSQNSIEEINSNINIREQVHSVHKADDGLRSNCRNLFIDHCIILVYQNPKFLISKYLIRKLTNSFTSKWKQLGQISHNEIIGNQIGCQIKSDERSFDCFWPVLGEYTSLMQSEPKPLHWKIAAELLIMGGVVPGTRVLEAGTGSGGLTMFLSNAVGKNGKVTSVEMSERFSRLAKKNIDRWRTDVPHRCSQPNNVHFINGALNDDDVLTGLSSVTFETIVFDLVTREIPAAIANYGRLLKSGGVMMFHCTNVSRAVAVISCLRESSSDLYVESVTEHTDKRWHAATNKNGTQVILPSALRDKHVGFLLKLRKVPQLWRPDISSYMRTAPKNTDLVETKEKETFTNESIESGDLVKLIHLRPRKGCLDKPLLLKLQSGAKTSTTHGLFLHDDIIGLGNGSCAGTSKGCFFLISRPSLGELLQKHISQQTAGLVVAAGGVKPGTLCLEVGGSPIALHLSMAAQSEGHVTSISLDQRRLNSLLPLAHQCLDSRYCAELSINVVNDVQQLYNHVQGHIFDAIFITGRDASELLEVLWANVWVGNFIIVMFHNFAVLSKLIELCKDLPLRIEDVWEQSERHWIIRNIENRSLDDFTRSLPAEMKFTSRPHNRNKINTDFVARIRRIHASR